MRKGLLFFLVIVFPLLCFTFAQTQQKKFTIRDMLSINVVSQMDISPDGKSVVLCFQKLISKKANTEQIFTLLQWKVEK